MGNCVSGRTNLLCYSSSSDSSSDCTSDNTIETLIPENLARTRRRSTLRAPIQPLQPIDESAWGNHSGERPKHRWPKPAIAGSLTRKPRHASNQTKAGSASETYLNGGYWPLWKSYERVGPSCIQVKMITHIHYAFAKIDDDGKVYLNDGKIHDEAVSSSMKSCLRAWAQHKRDNPHLKITLAIGGGDSSAAKSFVDVCASRSKRFTFVQSVGILIEKFGFDGVDVDWEYPVGSVEARWYLRLLVELRQALGWHRWLTTALPAGQWALKDLDLQQIARVVDFINLMAYDFVGPTFASVHQTGHHAQLYAPNAHNDNASKISAASAVDFLLGQGVASRKIMLGVPLYGRCFGGASEPGKPFYGPGSGKDATYEVKHLPRPGTVEKFDQSAVAAYASGNGEFITYDNQECVRRKAEFVKQKNLRGLFYWHLAGDRIGEDSLIRGGHEVLTGVKCR